MLEKKIMNVMRNKIIPLLVFMMLGFLSVDGRDMGRRGVIEQLKLFEKAMSERNYPLMESIIAPRFSIGVYHYQMKDKLLKVIVERYPEIISVKQSGKIQEDQEGNAVLPVTFLQQDNRTKDTFIAFDKNDAIRYVGAFDEIYGIDRRTDRGLIEELPFEIKDGKICIQIRLNNSEEALTMLFDTGADGIGLSPAAAKRVGINNFQNRNANVVGGSTSVRFSQGNILHLGEKISLKNQNLVVFPSHERKEDGLLGGNLLRNFTTRVDFDRKVIQLYDFNSFEPKKEASVINFNYGTGLPIIEAEMIFENKDKTVSGDLIFDTGAGYNLILFGGFVQDNSLTEGFKAIAHSTNVSMGIVSPTLLGELASLELADQKLENLIITLQEKVGGRKEKITNAGSLGIEVIKKFNFTIDALHKKIYLEPNANYSQPFEFVIGGMFLEFSSDDTLIVKEVIRGSKPDLEGVKEGDSILMIDGYQADEFKKESIRRKVMNSVDSNLTVRIGSAEQTLQLELPKYN